MIKKLQKHGDSRALVIDKPIMDAMGITEDTPLQVTVEGDSLLVRSANVGIGPERVREATAEIRRKYGGMLKRLAE